MTDDEKKKAFVALAQILGLEEPVAESAPEPPKSAPSPKPGSILDLLQAKVVDQLGEPQVSDLTHTQAEDNDDVDIESERAQSITDAMELIENAEAFVVVAVNKIAHPKAAGGVLVPMSILFNDNPMAELVAAVHLSNIASVSFQEMVLNALNNE